MLKRAGSIRHAASRRDRWLLRTRQPTRREGLILYVLHVNSTLPLGRTSPLVLHMSWYVWAFQLSAVAEPGTA